MDREQIENNEYKEFETKIYFKSGRVGYYKCQGFSEDDMLLKLSKAIMNGAKGCLVMKDMEDGKKTLINAQEIATFGVSLIGDNENE